MTCSREAYVKDIEVLLEAQHDARIPLLMSSAGGDGSNLHVDAFRDIIAEIAQRRGWHFKLASIYADIDKAHIARELKAGRIEPLGPVPPLDQREVDAATVIVAQMGAEPFLKALDESEGVDVIVSGRSYDPSPTAAMAIRAGFDPALAWHMGKIMECGALCAEPVGPQRHGLAPARPFRDRAAQSRRALHDGVGRGPHALRKDPSLPAGRPRRHARPVAMHLRAGDGPSRARVGQQVHSGEALHGEARRRQDRGLPQHLHRRRPRSDLHLPDRRDPGQGAGRHARVFLRHPGEAATG